MHTKGKWHFIEKDFTIRTKDFSSNAGMGDYKGVIIAHLDTENWRSVRPDSTPEKTASFHCFSASTLSPVCSATQAFRAATK